MLGSNIFCLPFHKGRKSNHHFMSSLALLFSVTGWDSLLTDVDKSIKRRRNVLPDGIIFDANDNLPIRDSNSRFVIVFFI